MSQKYEIDVKLYFKTKLQMLATEQMVKDFGVPWSRVFMMGLKSLEEHKKHCELINEMDQAYDAFFYLRQTNNQVKKGVTWNIHRVQVDKGRAKNGYRVKIYEMTELNDLEVLILYTDPNTQPGEFKSVKKYKKIIDPEILAKFFGGGE